VRTAILISSRHKFECELVPVATMHDHMLLAVHLRAVVGERNEMTRAEIGIC
jgi:hypothetical protein